MFVLGTTTTDTAAVKAIRTLALAFASSLGCATQPARDPAPLPAPTLVVADEPVARPESASSTPDAGVVPAAADAGAEESSAAEVANEPDWTRRPFEELPDFVVDARSLPLSVVITVVTKRTPSGTTAPLVMRIPSLGIEREIFDDGMVAPGCTSKHDDRSNALYVFCLAMDGGVHVRARQSGRELIVDVAGIGDVLPSMQSTTLQLPANRAVRLEARVPTGKRYNPGIGSIPSWP